MGSREPHAIDRAMNGKTWPGRPQIWDCGRVMAGLDPAIQTQVFERVRVTLDARLKAGHDEAIQERGIARVL
jgi:hypothetical protein